MTREAFLAASGLDKLAEMESVRAPSPPPGTSESSLASRVEWLSHLTLPKISFSVCICVTLCTRSGKIMYKSGVQFLKKKKRKVIFKPDMGRYNVTRLVQVDLSSSQFEESENWSWREKLSSQRKTTFRPFLKADPHKRLNWKHPSKHRDTKPELFLPLRLRGGWEVKRRRAREVEGERINQVDLERWGADLTSVRDFIIISLTHSWSGWPSVIRVCPFGSMTAFLILHLCCLIMGHAGQKTFVFWRWLGQY